MTMRTFSCLRLSVLLASLLALGLGACSRTWEGLKEDTGENLETTGQALEKAGEDIKKQTQ
jgi:predicted small secreted protein